MEQEKRKPGRPTRGIAKRNRLNLTVSDEERDALDYIAKESKQSISEIIGAWAIKEKRRLERKADKSGKPSK